MTGKELRERMHNGTRVYGTSVVSMSPMWPPMLKGCGLDFVFLDTEHVPQDRVQLSWMCRTYTALGLPPVVRMRRADPFRACQLIDDGAAGVIAPYMESPEQVRELVGAVKYRPLKGLRLEQALDDPSTLDPSQSEFLEDYNKNNVLIVNIESQEGIDRLEEILAVPGLDGVVIGPHDMTINLGVPEDYRHPKFNDAVKHVMRTAHACGIGAGVHFWDGIDLEVEWQQAGGNICIHSSDITLVQKGYQRDIAELRSLLGDEQEAAPEGGEVII